MLTLESIANGTKSPAGSNLSGLLYSQAGELPLANIARYLIESRPGVIKALRSDRQEQIELVCDDYDHICGLLQAYLQFVDEGFDGYPKAEWPVTQVEFLLASATPLAEMLAEVYNASLSQAVIDEITDSAVKIAALEQLVQRKAGPLRISVKVKNNRLVETPEPYYWMEACGLVGIQYVHGTFYIHIRPRGEATFAAAKAQIAAKVAEK